ncbi:MAG TPA: winged helix-turn-helix domain-containing protein [Hyphomicrobiaceae bacterium]|nr:winged helix-turn-helix domain-containing protein [Hyphomicrobiaceae bacterium]
MGFEFGPFCLDESTRSLQLEGREIALQPRVFDLLVFLTRNRDRVVSKDELLDTLWPGVTVTDNSLQRAVSSLRNALREGGLEDAVRNFSRNGYRFVVPASADVASSSQKDFAGNPLAAARQAILDQHWADAAQYYRTADGISPLEAKDLDGLALALQCLGQPSEAIPVLVRSVAAHAKAGDRGAAAASAISLSVLHLERGEGAVAKGWLSRSEDLTRAEPESEARGLTLWMQSRIAALDDNPQQAVDFADAAYQLGRRCGSARVEALGLIYRGFFKLSLGDTRAGLADQDHAAAVALSNNIDPITGGTIYCNILWACRTFGDWARASQWTLGYQQFCRDSGMGLSGSCQLHRAEVLGIQGTLQDALQYIEDALSRLTDDAPWAAGDAQRVLGDIHAAIGNTDAAKTAYEKSYAAGWNPEPGNAMLLLELGQPDAAYASLERSLIGQSWWTLQRQGMLLAHLAYVAACAGRYERAHALIHDLAGNEERWPMPSIRALVNEAGALMAIRQRGETNDALRRMHLARQLWTSIDSRLNATRVRLDIAALQLDLGDVSGAAAEIHAATTVAQELGSNKLKARAAALRQRL